MRRKGLVLILVGALALSNSFVSLAGWEKIDNTWKYSENGVYLTGWQWIDGNNDGVSECYYLGTDGLMLANTVIEGYTVNESGAWTVDGVIQTKVLAQEENSTIANNLGIDTSTLPGGFTRWIIEDKIYIDSVGHMRDVPGLEHTGVTIVDPNFHPVM